MISTLMRVSVAALLSVALTSCAVLKELQPAAETVAEGTYLYLDYNRMVATVSALDLNNEERAILRAADNELNALRLEIGSLYKGEGVEVLVSVLRASDIRAQLTLNFQRAVRVIESYYIRQDVAVPQQLRRFQSAAYTVDDNIGDLIDGGASQIDMSIVGSYLGLILRSMIAAKAGSSL